MKMLKDKTQKLRFSILSSVAKFITPTIFENNKTVFANFRPMIEFVKSNTKGELIGAEVGVGFGENAENILKTLPIRRLYLIDFYIPYKQNGVVLDFSEGIFNIHKLQSKFGNRVIFVNMTSEQAAKCNFIPNNLDFVYIDSNHAYEFVKKDIKLWWNKVRKGGIIGGHDFKIEYLDVCRAVLEFVKKNNLELYGKMTDWWVIKK